MNDVMKLIQFTKEYVKMVKNKIKEFNQKWNGDYIELDGIVNILDREKVK